VKAPPEALQSPRKESTGTCTPTKMQYRMVRLVCMCVMVVVVVVGAEGRGGGGEGPSEGRIGPTLVQSSRPASAHEVLKLVYHSFPGLVHLHTGMESFCNACMPTVQSSADMHAVTCPALAVVTTSEL
jgi:hypothetical protein